MNNSYNPASLKSYLTLFSNLNVNRTKEKGIAPYQPLLLLSVIDLIAERKIANEKIYINQELIDRFNHYKKSLYSEKFKGSLRLPFYHLDKSSFWKLEFSSTYKGGRPASMSKLKSEVKFAELNLDLLDLLQNYDSRQQLIDALLEAYFTSNNIHSSEITRINNNFLEYEANDLNTINQTLNEKKTYFTKSIVRNAFFRKTVVESYGYKCALCRMKVESAIKQNIVDGAHIKPLSIFGDNDIANGISLCKNHHWAFDNGLFGINDDYRIIVSKEFVEESPHNRSIREFSQEKLLLPASVNYFPRLDSLQWHYSHVFQS